MKTKPDECKTLQEAKGISNFNESVVSLKDNVELLNIIQAIDADIINVNFAAESKTWTFDPYDWKSDTGVLVAKEGQCKISLIKIPIVNSPFWKLYSTYSSSITSKGYKTYPNGSMDLEIYFVNNDGGRLVLWNPSFSLNCDYKNKIISFESSPFESDFFSLVKDVKCYPYFSVNKC